MPAEAPSADEIRRVAAEVLQRPDYELVGDRSAEVSDSLLIRALQWLLEAVTGLAESLAFLPGFLRYPFIALLCVLLLYFFYRIIRVLRRTARISGESEEEGRRSRANRTASPEELEAQANAARQDGRIVEAVRWLLRAAMLRIEIAEKRKPRPGTTNRELLRRYRATPLQQPLQTLVDTIDVHWYGDRPAESGDYERCHRSYEQLRAAMTGRAEAASEPQPAGSR